MLSFTILNDANLIEPVWSKMQFDLQEVFDG